MGSGDWFVALGSDHVIVWIGAATFVLAFEAANVAAVPVGSPGYGAEVLLSFLTQIPLGGALGVSLLLVAAGLLPDDARVTHRDRGLGRRGVAARIASVGAGRPCLRRPGLTNSVDSLALTWWRCSLVGWPGCPASRWPDELGERLSVVAAVTRRSPAAAFSSWPARA